MIRNVFLAGVIGLSTLVAQAQTVKISTNQGDIVVQLDAAKAPKTVANFLAYVKSGHYSGTIFHRVIDGFMIQGGGMTSDMREKPTNPPVVLESGNGLSHLRGTIAMARTNVPDSATAQFFINVKDNPMLNASGSTSRDGYTVFGKVTQGMDVVDKIRKVNTTRVGPHGDVPATPIIIKQVSIEK
ncbi:MAG: peptidyl-prolyl cis-trans isomerase [Aquabacterium sp.]|jgi:peptidyl-prolyl cis-trans isomerase A (cyclophilin A)|uniref:peptidylprolyl isomerase n=1 Tax=Aquabacterium sp. TaxID=1872578 RepID=UPI001B441CF0|nr:peptidylprolyl isomerase [Aquabacterium sp.]MBP7131559.1 peptidyl-prolyl cis-trans isomerase [Aquabacterium sp.]MBP9062703.1 peptidyl-prolyl cis-trans isomerase [Aquabacterium sp.]MDQ5926262.1 peptidyl-prolyl cis-trans isomerase [Pseudomonadota bacterium]